MTDSIYKPNFAISDGVEGVLEVIDQQRWLVDRMLLMPKYQAWIQRQVWTERVAATTSIEGSGIGVEAVGELARRGARGRPGDAKLANLNALAAYEFVDYVSDQPDIPINELVIRELNRQFMRGAAEPLTPGIYRRGENKVGEYSPPNSGDVPDLVRSLGNWLVEDPPDLHPIIKAGLAHIHLVAIHPFWDGNGRTARALMTLILQRTHFGFRKLLSLESTFANPRERYIEAIERTLGTQFNPTYDASPWLEFYAPMLLASVMQLTNQLTEWHRMMEELHTEFRRVGLSEREVDGLAFAIHTGRITRGDYIEIAGVSPITASRDLAHIVKSGLLEAQGKTRNRVYVFKKPPERDRAEPDPDRQARLPIDDD